MVNLSCPAHWSKYHLNTTPAKNPRNWAGMYNPVAKYLNPSDLSGRIKLTILIIRLSWPPAEIPWSYLFPSNRISFIPSKIFRNTRGCCSRCFLCNASDTVCSAGYSPNTGKNACQVPTRRGTIIFILFYNYIFKIFLSLEKFCLLFIDSFDSNLLLLLMLRLLSLVSFLDFVKFEFLETNFSSIFDCLFTVLFVFLSIISIR